MTECDLIKAARKKIQLGWCRETSWIKEEPPRYCILGALMVAMSDDLAIAQRVDLWRSAKARVAATIGTDHSFPGDTEGTIVHFNDYVARSAEDVLRLLDRAGEGK